jgi:hypothetical protein
LTRGNIEEEPPLKVIAAAAEEEEPVKLIGKRRLFRGNRSFTTPQ